FGGAFYAARLPPGGNADSRSADNERDCRRPRRHHKRSRHSNVAREREPSRSHWREVMTAPRDAYWDELGIAWCAIKPEVNVIAPRLKARLRRQSLLIAAA